MKVTATSDWRDAIPFETPVVVADVVPGEPTRCSVCGGDSVLLPRTDLWAVKHRHPNHHAGFVRFYAQVNIGGQSRFARFGVTVAPAAGTEAR